MKAERQKGLWDWLGVRETDDVIKKNKTKRKQIGLRDKKKMAKRILSTASFYYRQG